jgi:hypothetical protein
MWCPMTNEEQLQHWMQVDDPDWTQEEIEYEKNRLRALLRNPTLKPDERQVVLDTLAFWEV